MDFSQIRGARPGYQSLKLAILLFIGSHFFDKFLTFIWIEIGTMFGESLLTILGQKKHRHEFTDKCRSY